MNWVNYIYFSLGATNFICNHVKGAQAMRREHNFS